jgi:Spy/CpxP family protein refolding chaperone
MKNSTKILSIALVLLLLVNIAMLVFILKDKKRPARRQGKAPFENMVKELNMSDQQKKQYDSLREVHFSSIRPLFDSMRTLRQALFNQMKADTLNEQIIRGYSAQISDKQALADRLTLVHFRNVRSLFSGDQQRNSRRKDSVGKDK